MAAVAVTYTFVANTTANSGEVNQNFSDLVNYVNNRNSGSATWDSVYAASASINPVLRINNSTGTNNIANFQDNGTNIMTIADGGAVVITATAGGSSVPLTVNNSTSTGSIFIAQDNGSAVLTVADGGNITITGVLLGPAGAASAPTYSFTSEPDCGMYIVTTNTIGFAANGTKRMSISGSAVLPDGGGNIDFGNATDYWNDISYKTLTDRGCLPWADDGIELQDGTFVSDAEAFAQIKKHPTKLTVHGLPMLDYSTFPKVSYKKASVDGVELKRDVNGEPVGGQDGIEMTSVFGFMIGAIRELNDRLKKLEAV